MRADRLISLVLLLRQRGRLSASAIARELEVSTRTVLRDVEALSTAGVPVYTERGRHGGIALLPGFRAELTGLHHDEALALLAASPRGSEVLGLGPALAAAMRKVLDALPDRATAGDGARRILLDPDIDLLARREVAEQIPEAVLAPVRHAVLAGRRLALRYAAPDRESADRTVDPIGLVTARGLGYLLATADDGADRTYRLSRIEAAEVLPEPAVRAETVDLAALWRERSARFRAAAPVTVTLLLETTRLAELQATALTVTTAEDDGGGRLRLIVTFQDARHAEWALWQLGTDAETLAPAALRHAIHDRAAAVADRHLP